MNFTHVIGIVIALSSLSSACSVSRPCSEAGDVTWTPVIRGDRRCHQIKQRDGTYINDGSYTQYYPNGQVALEGEFKEGKKDGVWTQFNEEGEKVLERYFDHGVERSMPSPPSSEKKDHEQNKNTGNLRR